MANEFCGYPQGGVTFVRGKISVHPLVAQGYNDVLVALCYKRMGVNFPFHGPGDISIHAQLGKARKTPMLRPFNVETKQLETKGECIQKPNWQGYLDGRQKIMIPAVEYHPHVFASSEILEHHHKQHHKHQSSNSSSSLHAFKHALKYVILYNYRLTAIVISYVKVSNL